MRQQSHLWQQQQCQSQMQERAHRRQVQLRAQLRQQPGQEQAQGPGQRSLRPWSGMTGSERAASSRSLHRQQSTSPSAWALMHLHAAMLGSHTRSATVPDVSNLYL